MSEPAPTRARIITAPATGAIGVVRVVGPEALAAIAACFRPNRGRILRREDAGRPRYGRMGRGRGDEVVILVMDEAEVEIHGHAGPAALDSLVDELRGEGVAIGPGPIDEVEAMIARAATLRVADILLDQAGGAFDRERTRIEAFAESDPVAALAAASALIERAKVGRNLDRGWSVVLAGRPNVGKSRLLNAIAGFDRSIVSPIAGTTRDVVTARLAIDGWPVTLSDTAGFRDSARGVEAAGIDLAREARDRADGVLLILDRSQPFSTEDGALIAESPGALLVANKSDLPSAWDEAEIGALPVSAVSGDGLARLLSAISSRLVPDPPEPGTLVPILESEIAWLESFSSSMRGPLGRA